MVATADMVASASGKKVAINIRNTAGLSPIWNQSMAKGIHARGDKKRKKFSMGTKAFLAYKCWPSHSPNGIPNAADSTKPIATRHKEAMISFIKRPARNSSLKLFITAAGDGMAYAGKRSK